MTLGVSAWFGSILCVDHGKSALCLVFDKLLWGHGKIDCGWCRWWAQWHETSSKLSAWF